MMGNDTDRFNNLWLEASHDSVVSLASAAMERISGAVSQRRRFCAGLIEIQTEAKPGSLSISPDWLIG